MKISPFLSVLVDWILACVSIDCYKYRISIESSSKKVPRKNKKVRQNREGGEGGIVIPFLISLGIDTQKAQGTGLMLYTKHYSSSISVLIAALKKLRLWGAARVVVQFLLYYFLFPLFYFFAMRLRMAWRHETSRELNPHATLIIGILIEAKAFSTHTLPLPLPLSPPKYLNPPTPPSESVPHPVLR